MELFYRTISIVICLQIPVMLYVKLSEKGNLSVYELKYYSILFVDYVFLSRLLCYRFIGDNLCLPNPVSEGGLPLDIFLSM
jgi:hypothetical protein